jgi:polysaccharide biosynthesis/export protein
MKNKIVLFFLLGLGCGVAGAQQAGPGMLAPPPAATPADRLSLAMSNANYPVTPGDIYRLTYEQGNGLSALDIQVGSDSSIQLNIFGKLNASGMTFLAAKQAVEKAFISAYPRSSPSLAIASVGTFHVFVKGETPAAKNVDAWGMSRLSEILEGVLDPYSSVRNVEVSSRDGTNRQYDLFLFERSGEEDQNPYVRPGDSVTISTAERTVAIAGEVRRPGKYQLLPSDQLQELIEVIGGGLTAAADVSRIKIDRISGNTPEALYANLNQKEQNAVVLEDGDTVTVPSKVENLPVVYFEGAVTSQAPPGAAAAPTPESSDMFAPVGYNRIPYSFRQGETLGNALLSMRKSFLPDANLAGSFLVRQGVTEPQPVDLSTLLQGGNGPADFPLRPFDRIIVPAEQFSVSVFGDVTKPGNYPYTPSKGYRYYADLAGFADIDVIPKNIVIMDAQGRRLPIGAFIEPGSRIYLTASRVTVQGAVLNPGNFPYRSDFAVADYENEAGGFDPDKSTNRKVDVFDSKGARRKRSDALQPGDRIYVSADGFAYNFNRDLPVILSVITAVSTVVTIYALVR